MRWIYVRALVVCKRFAIWSYAKSQVVLQCRLGWSCIKAQVCFCGSLKGKFLEIGRSSDLVWTKIILWCGICILYLFYFLLFIFILLLISLPRLFSIVSLLYLCFLKSSNINIYKMKSCINQFFENPNIIIHHPP